MTTRLTETAVNKAIRDARESGRRSDISDATLRGLRLRVTPGGAASWVLACRDNEGRMRRFGIGAWPSMGISAARDASRDMKVKVKAGADPTAERRKKRELGKDARRGIGTLDALLALYADKRGHALKSWAECDQRIRAVFVGLLHRPVAALTASDIQMIADKHKSPHSASAAVRYLRPILKWGAQRGYTSAESALIRPPEPVRRRDRRLTEAELKSVLHALAASARPHARAFSFMLLTLARREEVAGACWRDIDLSAGRWTIPSTKNGQPHTVPLSNQAVALLRAELARHGGGGDRAGGPGGLVFATAAGGRLSNWDRETKALHAASKTTGWTRHDLRRTGATLLGEMGQMPHVIEAALNHVAIHSPIAAVYNRSRYLPEVEKALQALADRLDGIASGGAQVVPLRGAS